MKFPRMLELIIDCLPLIVGLISMASLGTLLIRRIRKTVEQHFGVYVVVGLLGTIFLTAWIYLEPLAVLTIG